ncbi:MAG: multicopper oxidase domain-containing protein [Acidimicrobiia bacterium]
MSETEPSDAPRSQPQAGPRAESLSVMGVVLAGAAVVFAVVAIGLSFQKVDEARGLVAGTSSATVEVRISEFAIDPAMVMVPVGGSLRVTNDGSAPHNLAVKGAELRTAMLDGGESAELDVSGLPVGDYTIVCEVPGHEGAGMTAMLHVLAGDTPSAAAGGPSAVRMSAEEMDAVMAVRTKAFPAATEGVGAPDLAPVVLADGTKEFTLTTSEIDWEVEPGKVVKAMAYNGTVPGPTIRVGIGDKVRFVVRNEMAESTAVHFHGLILPNAMDGVPDITQEPIKPGETFVYEFVAKGPAVGMYHSHHNAQVQVSNGLAGAVYVGELPLPAGVPRPAVDLPMMLNDAGTIGYSLNGKSFPATAPVSARIGDWVKIDYLNEGMQIHPMHLHGMAQLVIARDGFPLATPELADTVVVAPGQRVSVLVEATEPGVWAWHCHILSHAETSEGMFGMVTALVVS